MTPDEYEARLRQAVLAWWSEPALRDYENWLRLRAVAGQPCWRVAWGPQGESDPWGTIGGHGVRCIHRLGEELTGRSDVHLCPPCAAQQKIAAILAAAGGAG